MDDETPPVRRLTLKPKDIIPTDQVARTGDGTAISVQLIHQQNRIAAERSAARSGDAPLPGAAPRPTAIPFHPRKGPAQPAIESLAPADEEKISIHEMLRANEAAASEAGPELIAMPVPRKSRRRQDFAIVLGAAACATGILAAVFRHDSQMVALGMFVIVFATVILAWIMFGVMDRY
jgi:hypothetical protein